MERSNDCSRSVIFPLGEKTSSDCFVGTAFASVMVPNDEIFNCSIYNVTFELRGRNDWHKHPGGQILLVTGGLGYYQERGREAQLLMKGDVVMILPDVEHWHGAACDSWLSHIAICTNIDRGDVEWMDSVTEEEYNNLKNK